MRKYTHPYPLKYLDVYSSTNGKNRSVSLSNLLFTKSKAKKNAREAA